MAGFGSSIKLDGESEYQRALKQINQSLREVSSEMKVVSSSFDKNDKSTQAMAQKSDVLNKKLEEQKNKLSVLTQKYNEMNATYGKNSTAQQQLTTELTKARSKLEEIGNTLGKTSKEYQDQQKVVDQLEDKQVSFVSFPNSSSSFVVLFTSACAWFISVLAFETALLYETCLSSNWSTTFCWS